MIIMTPRGLYCVPGQFYIDPNGPVETAVVTHAHSDHARRGSQRYICTTSGTDLLKVRLGRNIQVTSYPYRQRFRINGVEVSFHSAGHILGSSQVRMEWAGEVWVASGDYKRESDPTCEPFESVACDVFITEATFGTPAFVWKKDQNLGHEIHQWWNKNAVDGMNSVLFAYSLGKAQRVLGLLEPFKTAPVHCHPAAAELNRCYLRQGVRLAPTICLSTVKTRDVSQGDFFSPRPRVLTGELFLVPKSFLRSPQAALLGGKIRTAFASGWMAKGTGGGFQAPGTYDHGFVLSDHADWNALVETVVESQAKRVYVQHRGNGALVRHLRQLGLHAFPDTELFPKHSQQMALF